jgi:hypothetical protein
LEKPEPLMTADGFYEKNVGSVSFFMRVASRGEIFDVMSFAVAALAGLTANAVFKVLSQEVLFP